MDDQAAPPQVTPEERLGLAPDGGGRPSHLELSSLQEWYALDERPGPMELGMYMDVLLNRTVTDVTEEAYARIKHHETQPSEGKGTCAGPQNRLCTILGYHGCHLFPAPPDPTVTIRQVLEEAAAWLNHIWHNSASSAHRSIRSRMEYGVGEARSIDPYDLLINSRDLVYYPLALAAAWSDLTRRRPAWVPLVSSPRFPRTCPPQRLEADGYSTCHTTVLPVPSRTRE